MTRLAVHVTPRAAHPGIGGWRGAELQVRVSAAPEAGKANAEACRTIATALGIAKSRVRVVRGETSRHKELDIDGATEADLAEVFGEA